MEAKAKLTKEMICEEARFILANILAEGRYGKQNHLDDIRRICEGAVSLALDEYIVFLETYGYLSHDRRSDTLDVTSEGERVVSGDKTQELMGRVLAHFVSRSQSGVTSAALPRRTRAFGTPPPPPGSSGAAGGAGDDENGTSTGIDRVIRDVAGEGNRDSREILDRRYEKIERIGSGGIRPGFPARPINLQRAVSVKEVRELFHFFTEEQRREIQRRFGEVVRSAARLSHPNIMPLIDVNSEREYPYMVMELAPHGNLRRIIKWAEEIPVPLAIKYFVQA